MKLAVIADDFTGSNDTGVQFAKKKMSTIVTTKTENIPEDLMLKEVLVVDTESRFDDDKTAYDKVYRVTEELKKMGDCIFYKKIDSTFRGNIGSEIAACLDASGKNVVYMIPALPSNGRTSKNGRVYVNGTPLHETEVAKDPKTPVKESSIAEIIRNQSEKKTVLISKDGSYKADLLKQMISKAREEKAEIVIFDAENTEDLKVCAEVISSLDEDYILAGTAGLAEFVPDAFGFQKKTGVLSIIGSVSDVTRSQIEYAKERLPLHIIHYKVDMMFDEENKRKIAVEIAELLKNGNDVALYTAENRNVIDQTIDYAEAKGMSHFEISDFIAKSLGEITGDLMRCCKENLSGVYITGGDTLIKIAKELDISGMIIKDEVLPAIPIGRFVSDEFEDIDIVTKAGAFGKEDAFYHILHALKK
ncbi:four-carbon acid sugar kinase family protein [Proteiniclasticum sp. SCR006]|uniref:Four-carbon acid sugar kinase family protein n=1 Tax=Proteiniclasticum aestuarii TaxID=2817862 RepID=A0A939KHG4_9CLOT|nr:four-carbon acid sugar kinase family protein [Proteiniclasticum aestuarii]MBO1265454.1 four-carbon acid sugar kinase family protein [Proteiniclasticum aestuarii]